MLRGHSFSQLDQTLCALLRLLEYWRWRSAITTPRLPKIRGCVLYRLDLKTDYLAMRRRPSKLKVSFNCRPQMSPSFLQTAAKCPVAPSQVMSQFKVCIHWPLTSMLGAEGGPNSWALSQNPENEGYIRVYFLAKDIPRFFALTAN